MKKASFIVFIVGALLMYGCYKKEEISITENRKAGSYRYGTTDYIVLFQGETVYSNYFKENKGGGTFHVEELNGIKSQLSAAFFGNGNQLVDVGTIQFGSIVMNSYRDINRPNNQQIYYLDTSHVILSAMQQTVQTFTMGVNTPDEASVDVYVSLRIDVDKPAPNSCGTTIIGGGRNPRSYDIDWNADATNRNGVIVLVHYGGDIITDDSLRTLRQGSDNFDMINIVPDNGKLTIDETYLKHLPDGAIFTVELVRGDVKLLDYKDNKYQISTLSRSSQTQLQLRRPTQGD